MGYSRESNAKQSTFEIDYIINVYVNSFILMFYVSDSFADLGN